MTLPKMMPMPTPAPTAPRPPPTPRAIARPASAPASAWAKTVVIRGRSRSSTAGSFGLVGLGDRAAEVDGRERGEDERLKGGDQPDLEEEQGDAERQREHAEDLEAQQHREPAGHEEDDQVAGEDVGEESNGERQQPHEVREELEREDRDAREPGDPLRDQAGEIAAEALDPDPLHVVGDEDDQREHERDRDVRRRRV